LFILGSVPAIVRCWLDTNFKHDALLYAAICSGSYKSYLDIRLITKLGLEDRMGQDINGDTKIKLSMYLPEAVLQPASSRSSSPAPQLPTMTVDFAVMDCSREGTDSKAIQVFLGSDTLRAHNADILFSSNTMILYDDERNKLSLPLVRPENDETFKSLYVTSITPPHRVYRSKPDPYQPPQTNTEYEALTNGYDDDMSNTTVIERSESEPRSGQPVAEPIALGISTTDTSGATSANQNREAKPSLVAIDTTNKSSTASPDGSPTIASASRATTSPAIWSGNWRSTAQSADWTSSSRQNSAIYMRPNREQGIKVLKPSRQVSRSTSSSGLAPPSPVAGSTGQSRYFDDGRRKNGVKVDEELSRRGSLSGGKDNSAATAGAPQGSKLRSVNPVGGASAFGWLNSAQTK